MMMNVIIGTIFALIPRPIPKAERRLCQASARPILARPSRGPS